MHVFDLLQQINTRPEPWQFYTAEELWTDEHTARKMLEYHLHPTVNAASRNHAFIDRSVAWITEHFKLTPRTRIADFGCGPGLYTTRLARYGARVTGVDFSLSSLEYARKAARDEGLAINYHHTNYLEFESDQRFDLIIMIMCDFCALSPVQRRIMLQKFCSLLAPGGAVLLDVYSLAAFDTRTESATYELNQLSGFWSASKYYGFVNVFKYDREKVVLDKYTLIEPGRIRTVYNWLQHYSPESLKQELAENGIALSDTYADVAGSPFDPDGSEFAVVGRIA
ncbi:methyltransferase domain-containing protein [candidate division GN15 bacterium]|nr:methyltransferase domain-containing protein [candidate division GN15 bacterium]